MVEDLQKTLLEKPNLEIKVLYDISCMLVKHLQVSFAYFTYFFSYMYVSLLGDPQNVFEFKFRAEETMNYLKPSSLQFPFSTAMVMKDIAR